MGRKFNFVILSQQYYESLAPEIRDETITIDSLVDEREYYDDAHNYNNDYLPLGTEGKNPEYLNKKEVVEFLNELKSKSLTDLTDIQHWGYAVFKVSLIFDQMNDDDIV